jgi:hypothetical protein
LGTISPTAAHPIWCIEEPSPMNTEPPIRVLIFLPSALIKFPNRPNKFPTIKTFRLPKISPSCPTIEEVCWGGDERCDDHPDVAWGWPWIIWLVECVISELGNISHTNVFVDSGNNGRNKHQLRQWYRRGSQVGRTVMVISACSYLRWVEVLTQQAMNFPKVNLK